MRELDFLDYQAYCVEERNKSELALMNVKAKKRRGSKITRHDMPRKKKARVEPVTSLPGRIVVECSDDDYDLPR